MLLQLSIGSFMIVVTVIVQVFFIGGLTKVLKLFGDKIVSGPPTRVFVFATVFIVLWLLAGLTACSWLWALLFLGLDTFNTIEPALYFTIVTFTTLGFGDIVLSEQWRLLSALASVNGLIIVGLNTAFLAESLFRIRAAQHDHKPEKLI